MTKEYYRDPYGCTASITRNPDGTAKLTVRTQSGSLIRNDSFASYQGAKIALGKMSDGMMTIVKKEE